MVESCASGSVGEWSGNRRSYPARLTIALGRVGWEALDGSPDTEICRLFNLSTEENHT